jgi:hypothetical protein
MGSKVSCRNERILSTVAPVTPNFALLEMSHPEVASLWPQCCKLVMQLNAGHGRTRKNPRAKNGGPTCWMICVLAQAVTPRRIDDDVQCGKRETRRARR